MRIAILIFGVFSALSGAANAEKLSLKGIVPGETTREDILDRDDFDVTCAERDICILGLNLTLAGKPTESFAVQFHGDVVMMVGGSVSTENAEYIARAVTEKFGVPKIDKSYKKNGFGVSYTSDDYLWEDDRRVLQIHTVANKVGSGSVFVTDIPTYNALSASKAEKAKSAADDL